MKSVCSIMRLDIKMLQVVSVLGHYAMKSRYIPKPMKSISVFIITTMGLSGFAALPYHNNILTLGEWGWCLGMKKEVVSKDILKAKVMDIDLPPLLNSRTEAPSFQRLI